MNDLVTLCLLGVFAIVGLMLLTRLMRSFAAPDYSQRGDEYPRYDDPDIDSRGSFGHPGQRSRPQYDDPDIDSRGSFGRPRSTPQGSRRKGAAGGRIDSPRIRSRGSFGRGRK